MPTTVTRRPDDKLKDLKKRVYNPGAAQELRRLLQENPRRFNWEKFEAMLATQPALANPYLRTTVDED